MGFYNLCVLYYFFRLEFLLKEIIMKKTLLLLMSVFVLALVSAHAQTPACNACHAGLPEAALQGGKAHPIQFEGVTQKMTNPMHMGLKSCNNCHDAGKLKDATTAAASLKGGSVAALGAMPACAGCHSGAPAAKPADWNMERVKLHTFSK